MLTSAVKSPGRTDTTLPLPNQRWLEALTRLTQNLTTPDFYPALVECIKTICPQSEIICTLYPDRMGPQSVYHELQEAHQIELNTRVYDQAAFRLDPFYQAVRNGFSGVCRMRELAPGDFDSSLYYRTFYKNVDVGDEVGLFFEVRRQERLVVSIGLMKEEASERLLRELRALHPLLAAMVLRHGEGSEYVQEAAHAVLNRRLRNFGQGVLTEREQDVAQLMLRGCTTREIIQLLGVREGTVKVHRKHIYSKLGINAQAELFGLFMDSLQGV
ncbi:response regulator transcription factor [Endozoicomonas atrinae]|uniref:response regulator transcription factor n=1 Tax=Endozoicomonas atrinae TaxID=1333660 RepID=UPI003AFF98C8